MTSQIGRLIIDLRHQYDLFGLTQKLFRPVLNFMNQNQAKQVCEEMKIDNCFFPLPILLRINDKQAKEIYKFKQIHLCSSDQTNLATLDIHDIYPWDIRYEAHHSLGTTEPQHPYYQYLRSQEFTHCISGNISKSITQRIIPPSGNWNMFYRSPEECQDIWRMRGIEHLVGFQTRNPLHRSHMELIKQAIDSIKEPGMKAGLLHPVIGPTQDQDVDPHTRVRLYQHAIKHFGHTQVFMNLLPINMRMAGPREACWHAIIRRNVGCTHFIVGRDHAGPTPKKENGEPFYEPFAAQELAKEHQKSMGIKILPMKEMVYDTHNGIYKPSDEVQPEHAGKLSGTALRKAIAERKPLPKWFTIPEVERELRRVNEIKSRHQGLCIYAFGLSGSGKTTTLQQWSHLLKESGFHKPITILDGDEIRREWSPDLGFSPEDRKLHVRRIGKLAALITEHGGCVFVANIAPFEADREHNRQIISSKGKYLDIFFDIPIEECARRDVKGFYATNGKNAMNVFQKPTIRPSFTIQNNDEQNRVFEEVLRIIRETYYYEFP